MTDPVLQADLEALGRLKPEVQTLVWQVTQGLPHEIPTGGTVDAGAVPSLAAAQEMSTRTLPTIKATVAGRFSKLADMIHLCAPGICCQRGTAADGDQHHANLAASADYRLSPRLADADQIADPGR